MEIEEYHKAMLTRLVQGEAWKVVMRVIGTRLATLESQLRHLSGVPHFRTEILDRRNELLDFIMRLYRYTDIPNPIDEHAFAVWAQQIPLPKREDVAMTDVGQIEVPPAVHAQRMRQGGSIA